MPGDHVTAFAECVALQEHHAGETAGVALMGTDRPGRAFQLVVKCHRYEAGIGPGEFVGERGGRAERG